MPSINSIRQVTIQLSAPLALVLLFQNCGNFTSMTGGTSSSSKLSALTQSVDNKNGPLDYLIQDVCVDGNDHVVAGDPASCANHRNVRIGESVPYLITDYDTGNGNRYQGLFSYPVPGNDGNLKLLVSKMDWRGGARPLNAGFTFSFDVNHDGYDLQDLSGDFASGIRTSDPGCFDQKIGLTSSQRTDGWLTIPLDVNRMNSSTNNTIDHNTFFQILTAGSPCSNGQVTDNSVQDTWNPPVAIHFESGKTLMSVMTYHFANKDLSQQNNALERAFYTREYGFTRWEAWIPQSRCLAQNSSDTQICYPERNNYLIGRCTNSNISGYATYGNQTWVRTDCRDNTYYVALNTALIPLDSTMAQNDGVNDINSAQVFAANRLPLGPFIYSAGIFYSNGAQFCWYSSWAHFTSQTGLTTAAGLTTYTSIPSSMQNNGVCPGAPASDLIPAGPFIYGGGIFYSNGSHFCWYNSMSSFTALTGRTTSAGLTTYATMPSDMVNDGTCH